MSKRKDRLRPHGKVGASVLAHSSDESLIALGDPFAGVYVFGFDAKTGKLTEPVCRVWHHRAPITALAFVALREGLGLVSVAEDGSMALSDPETGKVLKGVDGKEREDHRAAFSPDGKSLFLCREEMLVRVALPDLKPANETELPVEPAALYGLDDERVLIYGEDPDHDDVVGFDVVTFPKATRTRRNFEYGPTDRVRGAPVLHLDPKTGLGVRHNYRPIQTKVDDEETIYLVRLEVFELDALEMRADPAVAGYPAGCKPVVEWLEDAEDDEESYLHYSHQLTEEITSVHLTPEGDGIWLGLLGGAVRRVGVTDDDLRTNWIWSGWAEEERMEQLTDAEKRALWQVQPLHVSPSGANIAFGYPTQFFNVAASGVEDEEGVTVLPLEESGSD